MPFNSGIFRGGSKTAVTSKIERFMIIVTGFQPLNIITKCSILDAAAVLDPLMIFRDSRNVWIPICRYSARRVK